MANKADTWRYLTAFFLGAVAVAAFAPVACYPLIWFVFAAFYAINGQHVNADQPRKILKSALLGWSFGFGMFITGVSWIYVSLSVFGGMPLPLAALATLLFCAAMALYPALANAIFALVPKNRHWLLHGMFFASLWTLTEWMRSWILTGFPWLSVGYSQSPPSILSGFVPLAGVFGLSWLSVFLGTLIYVSFVRFQVIWSSRHASNAKNDKIIGSCPWQSVMLPLLMVAGLLVTGKSLQFISWVAPAGEPFTVSLLQGNVPQQMKWQPEKFAETLRLYYQMARQSPAQLTILPETAFPAFLEEMPADYMTMLNELAQREHRDMLFGIILGNRTRYANGAVSIGISGEQYYLKSHLVPFGEFVPEGFSWLMSQLSIPMSDFVRGRIDQAPLQIAGRKLAVNICYEDAFGEEIIRMLPQADVLANISNVAWFGDSLAPRQHLQIAQLRALETGRMMLRATNTGMTAIINVDGTILAALEPFTRGVLQGKVRGYQGNTPYVRWGNMPIILFSLLCVIYFCLTQRRKLQSK